MTDITGPRPSGPRIADETPALQVPERDPVTGRATTGHEWDGIRELNTPLPKWWVYTFIATIVFSVLYCVLYPAVPGLTGYTRGLLGYSTRAELSEQIAAASDAQVGLRARLAAASLDEIRHDPELLAFAATGGKVAFAENCAGCHRAGGAGAKGYPALADDEWLWGGTLADIHRTIVHGIRSGDPQSRLSTMPRFGLDGMLTPAQIDTVADYVLSLSSDAPAATATGEGEKLYADNCASCHGARGEGNREFGAPSLRDRIWLHGGDKADIVATITRARNGSMPGWGERLDPATIKMLTVYVHALGGGE